MAIDAEFISSRSFNLKLKNYLRDFYIYQFKEKSLDFKVKGSQGNLNKNILDSTFNADVKRLRYALEQTAGVKWDKGENNKQVECVTIDTRQIFNNPFFSLYQLCNENTKDLSRQFTFIYNLLLYFQLGKQIERTDYKPLDDKQIENINGFLKYFALVIESKERHHAPKIWNDFSNKEKSIYAKKAIEKFLQSKERLESYLENDKEMADIHKYIFLNKQKIEFIDGIFTVTYDKSNIIERNYLHNVIKYYDFDITTKTIDNKMIELSHLGIVTIKKSNNKTYYCFSSYFINDLINKDNEGRFIDCVSFFSQISPFGEIGTYILNRLEKQSKDYILFKHHYIKNALNDYNIIDLLYAIKNNLWTVIEYRNATMNDLKYQKIFCYPIEIRESVTDGRQYLIYYYPKFQSVSAVRIEFIDSIAVGKYPSNEYLNDINNAKELIKHTWGVSFENFYDGNVKKPIEFYQMKIVIHLNDDFIKRRLQREERNFKSFKEIILDSYGRCIEIEIEVTNPKEILKWVRSYISRVVLVEINGRDYTEFINDVKELYSFYKEPISNVATKANFSTNKSFIMDDIPKNFKKENDMHSLLFNELFSVTFNSFGKILLNILKKKLYSRKEIDELTTIYSNSFNMNSFTKTIQDKTIEKREFRSEIFITQFTIPHKNNMTKSIFSLIDDRNINNIIDLLPLTSLEIQWLSNILKHPYAKYFLDDDEIKQILNKIDHLNLFDICTASLFDQYNSIENNQLNHKIFRDIRNSIKNNQNILISYTSQYGIQKNYLCSPIYIEYSKRDNQMRVIAINKENRVQCFVLERINDVSLLNDKYNEETVKSIYKRYRENNEKEIVIEFNEEKNTADRILTEFSCYKKRCVKYLEKNYHMTLYYDKDDSQELVIRLLGYGTSIKILSDTGNVLNNVISRLERQLEMFN